MYKCNKEFNYGSKLKELQNRKISYDLPKESLKCILCHIKFNRPADKKRRINTQKHINNEINQNFLKH